MEREPRPEPTRYFVDYDGERYILGPENTLVYLHDENKYDHIYVQFKDDENGDQQGTYLWRLDPRYNEQFESMVSNLKVIDTTMIYQKEVSNFDLEQWTKKFGDIKEPTKEIVPVLTDRQINRGKFLGYLLLNDLLIPADFYGDGDLYI